MNKNKKHHTMKRIKEWNFLFVLLLALLSFSCSSNPDDIVDPDDPDIPVTPKPDDNKPEQNMNFQFSVEGVDKPYDFYSDCSIVSPFDEVKISANSKTMHTEKSEKVQTFYLSNDNDEVYLISRVSDTKANKDMSFDIRNTAMAYVTLHPFFAHVDSTAYQVLTEAIGMNEHFTPLYNEVARLVKQKKDLYAEDNTQLMQALNTLLDDMIDLSPENRDSLAGSRAVEFVSQYYPLKVKGDGRVVQFQVFGLSPNYYGTVTHANGKTEKIVVKSHDNFGGYLDFMKTVADLIQQNGFESHYGDVTKYTYPEDGEAKFDFTCRGINGNVDIATRIASDILDALGIDFPGMNEFASLVANEVLVEYAQTINNASAINGEFTMGVFPYFTGDIGENIGNIIEFANTITIKTAENIYEKILEDQFEYATTFSKEALAKRLKYLFKAYGIVSTAGNMIGRICEFCKAPENINFNLCCYQSEVSNCSTIGIARGNNQAGVQYTKLQKPISVFVSIDNEMTDDYLVAFKVTEGGGSVSTEYAKIGGNMAETEWTLGSSSKAQKVQAYLCDKTTKEKRSKVVEFEATAIEEFEIEIAGGDEQTGKERKVLPEKLQVSLTDHDLFDTSYYRIKFEVWEGSGSVSPEYAELANGIAQCEWTLGDHDDEEQVVRAVLVSASTQEELSEPIYFDAYTEENEELREALIRLYNSTNGDNWACNEHWCSDRPVHEWYGVNKDENGKYEINLLGNHLTGIIDQKFPDCVISLNCFYNRLTSLNVSGCTALEELNCEANQLTSLDVSGCTALKALKWHNDQLTSLNVTGCTALEELNYEGLYWWGVNQLTSLNVSGCTALKKLYCEGNQLTSLNVSGCTALEELNCNNNQLTSLDVSGCTALKGLWCKDNQLTSLDVSGCGCTALEELDCNNNQLTSLNVSGCKALKVLKCDNDQLTSLNVSGTALEELELWLTHLQLTSLNVSGCTALKKLECNDNQLTSLNVSGCTALKKMECYNNQLTSLNVSTCTALEELHCENNQLTSLNVSGCTALEKLHCETNQFTSLNVSGCTALEELDFYNNPLTSLNVSGCTALKNLSFHETQLTSLNVSGCTAFEDLWCTNLQLTSLNVSGCTGLKKLNCYNNQLTSLNVSGCTALEELDCFNNQLTSLDVSTCTALEELECYNNQLTSLDVSTCTALKRLYCNDNQLTSLNVTGCMALKRLNCENNRITSVVPDWFSQLQSFIFYHDARYTYSKKNGVTKYKDNGYGWWYPGEPEKGYHARD